ncbi:MAG: queuosine precursor transporter [Chlamydiales bacterium]|nr:queuosine precursor transporter [Chlamydiia bacterium]MCP5508527.1 queuosine precursor transporter [Chlamydiales bacterium]
MQILYLMLCVSFTLVVVLSNVLSGNMISLAYANCCVPAGLLTYPLTFLLSDLVSEVYGAKKATKMVYLALSVNLACFCLIEAVLFLYPVADARREMLNLGALRIFASLSAYLVAQTTDIQLYSIIRKWSGEKWLWLRNNCSTCLSQMLDTFIIDMIFLYWGMGMEIRDVAPIMCISYCYKAFFSVLCTPLLYLFLHLIKNMNRMFLMVEKGV